MEGERQYLGYCERLGPEFWAEPVNAVSNAAFLIAALVMWYRCRRTRAPDQTLLCLILAAIGVGSFLFHTLSTGWAALADMLPILIFILVYLYASNRRFWGFGAGPSLALTACFLPYAVLLNGVFEKLPFFSISSYYWSVPLLIAAYAVLLRDRLPLVACGLAMGAGILSLSLVFRSLDQTLCGTIPFGTHFLWHILNAVMLGWMIEVLRHHRARTLAAAGAGR